MPTKPRIMIIGGGAGGLELATRLGKKFKHSSQAQILLIDESATHLWKPLLHEVAAGTLDANQDELDYFIHGSMNGYQFVWGKMLGLDRKKKQIVLAPVLNDAGEEIFPKRLLAYDVLVLAFGSITNDFNVPGVTEFAYFLDDRRQADRFQQLLLKKLFNLQNLSEHESIEKLNIVIVGGGATGVELAAELQFAIKQAEQYGVTADPSKDIGITVIEAANRLLPILPERTATLATEELKRQHIQVLTSEKVVRVTANEIYTASGKKIPASIVVWSVGVKAASFEDKLDGLILNHRNQVVVNRTLQTTLDPSIFAFGDCAACPQLNSKDLVPPRAQSAHQQAQLLSKSLLLYLQNKPLLSYQYKDYGSLISLSRSQTLGYIMGKLLGNVLLEGKLARLIYLSLYKKHQQVLYGTNWVFLHTIANWLIRKKKARLKLH